MVGDREAPPRKVSLMRDERCKEREESESRAVGWHGRNWLSRLQRNTLQMRALEEGVEQQTQDRKWGARVESQSGVFTLRH